MGLTSLSGVEGRDPRGGSLRTPPGSEDSKGKRNLPSAAAHPSPSWLATLSRRDVSTTGARPFLAFAIASAMGPGSARLGSRLLWKNASLGLL